MDCSGQATFLANRGITGKKIKGSYTNQVAVFSQLSDMVLDSGPEPSQAPGNTLIFYKQKDHWAWMIPLSNTITSVGVVVPATYFKARKLEFKSLDTIALGPVLLISRDLVLKFDPENPVGLAQLNIALALSGRWPRRKGWPSR